MLTPDLLSWTLGATVGINRWSSERNAKTDFEHCRVATEEGKAKYGGAQVATEDMLTPDLLSWTLGATIGINRWSSERNAKTDFEHSCLGKRQSRAAESRQRKAKPSTRSSLP